MWEAPQCADSGEPFIERPLQDCAYGKVALNPYEIMTALFRPRQRLVNPRNGPFL